MRTWGRVNGQWVKVETAPDGSNDLVYIVTLIQVLKLNLNESPFFANYGIPAHQSVIQQVAPDFNVALTQQFFASYFASLSIIKRSLPTPTYDVRIVTHQGVVINEIIPV
jgi:hypothetical protein